jgi:predicted DNA-binding transcriptional regulator AlpA
MAFGPSGKLRGMRDNDRTKPDYSDRNELGRRAQMRRARCSSLPPSLAPRGLTRPQAAEYVGVGPTKFDEMVADGRMPRPKRVDGRVIWDRVQLDEAFAALDNDAAPANEWDRL